MQYPILVVSKDADFVSWATQALRTQGFSARGVSEVTTALELVRTQNVACLITNMDGEGGDSSARNLWRAAQAGSLVESLAPLVVVVAAGDVRAAVAAMRNGAESVVEREASGAALIEAVQAVIHELAQASPALGDPRDLIIRHERSPLNELVALFPQIAPGISPVLITGESGTGKELFARILHRMSDRSDGPFITVHCGAIPEGQLESELYGHVKGAFSEATGDRIGSFQAAHGGTIFLDDIGSLSLQAQGQLLRTLKERKVQPVGAAEAAFVDFRIITSAATSLEEAIEEGRFRSDLYYHLNVFLLELPPLRQRTMDIGVLAEHYIAEHNVVHDTKIESLSTEIRRYLREHDWPGNVRELHNVMQRLCVAAARSGRIEEADLPAAFFERDPFEHMGLDVPSEGMDITATLDMLEDRLLTMALIKTSGNKARAARLLGLNRTTLVEKLKRRRIDLN